MPVSIKVEEVYSKNELEGKWTIFKNTLNKILKFEIQIRYDYLR